MLQVEASGALGAGDDDDEEAMKEKARTDELKSRAADKLKAQANSALGAGDDDDDEEEPKDKPRKVKSEEEESEEEEEAVFDEGNNNDDKSIAAATASGGEWETWREGGTGGWGDLGSLPVGAKEEALR